jgi:hypothetical protein
VKSNAYDQHTGNIKAEGENGVNVPGLGRVVMMKED